MKPTLKMKLFQLRYAMCFQAIEIIENFYKKNINFKEIFYLIGFKKTALHL